MIDLLKTYFRLDDRDQAHTIREKVMAALLVLDAALQPTLPAFLTLLNVPAEAPHWQALAPPQRRQRILDALKRLVLRRSQAQPLLLTVENLHWIDAETQACLDQVVEGLPAARLLVLVTYRPEYQHGWGRKTYYTSLRLDPLSHPDVDKAAAHYRQSLALAEELGMRPLQAHCHLGLGVLYQRMGKREPARVALSTAIEFLRAMEMTFWLPRAAAALASADVLAVLDEALQQHAFLDPARLGLIGGSYGGYLVGWIVGHTDRFAAAVPEHGLYNRYSKDGTSDIWSGHTYLRVHQWQDPELY